MSLRETSEIQGPCCAHRKVLWTTEQIESGLTRGWWECSACKIKFMPIPLHEHVIREQTAIIRANLVDEIANFVENNTPYLQGTGSVGVPMANHIRSLASPSDHSALAQVRIDYEATIPH